MVDMCVVQKNVIYFICFEVEVLVVNVVHVERITNVLIQTTLQQDFPVRCFYKDTGPGDIRAIFSDEPYFNVLFSHCFLLMWYMLIQMYCSGLVKCLSDVVWSNKP